MTTILTLPPKPLPKLPFHWLNRIVVRNPNPSPRRSPSWLPLRHRLQWNPDLGVPAGVAAGEVVEDLVNDPRRLRLLPYLKLQRIRPRRTLRLRRQWLLNSLMGA